MAVALGRARGARSLSSAARFARSWVRASSSSRSLHARASDQPALASASVRFATRRSPSSMASAALGIWGSSRWRSATRCSSGDEAFHQLGTPEFAAKGVDQCRRSLPL
jgi:hypothetical protein